MIYKERDFEDWRQQNLNGSYLEYLKEQVRWIELELQFPALLSKERIIYLEREEEYFLAKIHGLGWDELKLKFLNSSKSLWQTSK